MIEKSRMIDGDAFHYLARKHKLFYSATHLLRSEHQVDRIAALPAPANILSHNSDGGIPAPGTPLSWFDFVWDEAPDNIGHWFAQNCDVWDLRLTPIPIGLECDRWHPPSMKKDVILATPQVPRDKLVYLNHTVRASHRTARQVILDLFADRPWVTFEQGRSFEHYAQQLARHKFVFSPDGNGMDCVRTWEALYLGCYPLVERHVFTEEFAEYLPLLIVDDWAAVTEDFLRSHYDEMVVKAWNWDALTIGWWDELIRGKV